MNAALIRFGRAAAAAHAPFVAGASSTLQHFWRTLRDGFARRRRLARMQSALDALDDRQLHDIGLHRVHTNGYAFQVEMAYLAERLGFRVKEIPIYFEDRRIGKSKMDVPVKLQGALDVIRIRYRHRHVERPQASHPALPTRP